jgi:predicted ATPase
LFFLGAYAAARTHFEQGSACIELAVQRAPALRRSVRPSAGVVCLAQGACTLWGLGYPAQARQRSQAALALAQDLAHPYSLAYAQFYALFLQYFCRDAAAVQATADALLTLATTQGFPYWEGVGRAYRGWALAMQGEGERGLAQLRQGYQTLTALAHGLSRPPFPLAEALGHTGQVAEGLGVLTEVLTAFAASGRADVLAEGYRLQGALLVRQAVPEVTHAEACFQQALTVARRQQAKAWELRAALSLARLWQGQGKRAAAYDLLAPVYGWFTEGFDTADLQEARALLKALG